jgi:hypothetical protein
MAGRTDGLMTGKMTRRAQSKITQGMDEAIAAVAKDLAGDSDPRMMRSRAIRELLVEGLQARAQRLNRDGRRTE